MEAVDVRGRFVWHQLMTRNVTGAKYFYSTLLGWRAQAWPPDPAYTVCHSEGAPIAGMMEIPADLPAEVPAHWLTYIGTRDVDAVADAAVSAGGSVVRAPSDLRGAGRYAVLKDPQGAVFAIIDPENARAESAGAPPDGHFAWHELATSDNEAALAFYSNLFGWDAITRLDMGPVGVYLVFGRNGMQCGGMYIKPPEDTGPPSWLPYVQTASADEAYRRALSIGASSLVAPMEVPDGGRIANILDPAGAPFALMSTATEPAAKPKAKSKVKVKAKPKPKPKPKPKRKAKAGAKAKSRKALPSKKKKVAKKKVIRRATRKKSPPRKRSKSARRKK